MGRILAFPVIFILIVLQTTIVTQITLINGCADLILLWLASWSLQKQVKSAWFWTLLAGIGISYISAVPWFITLIGYSAVTLVANQIKKRMFQSPLIMLFFLVIFGSLIMNGLTYIVLQFSGVSISLKAALVETMLPSMLINLLVALPVYAFARDTAQWVYPKEVTE